MGLYIIIIIHFLYRLFTDRTSLSVFVRFAELSGGREIELLFVSLTKNS